jgi:hypothetical protein
MMFIIGTGIRRASGPGLVRRAVQPFHRIIDAGLIERIENDQCFADFAVYVADGLQHPLPQVPVHVAVAQFHGFARPGRRTRGHGCPAECTALREYLSFDGRITARIDNLPATYFNNLAHPTTCYINSATGLRPAASLSLRDPTPSA